MKPTIAIGSVVALLAVAAAGTFYLRERDETPAIDSHARASDANERAESAVARPRPADKSTTSRVASPPRSAQSSLQEQFAAASDYRDFARSVLDAAKAGNPEAQFFLYQALDFCAMGYRFYFDRRSRRRTLDEALQWASTRTPSADLEEVRDVYDKCHLLMEKGTREQFGTTDDWLAAATEGGHPVAQARTAGKLLLASLIFDTKADSDSATEAKLASERRDRGMRLMTDALGSGDPAVLWTLGDYGFALAGDGASKIGWDWAWRIAACQRGYDCGAGASWHKFYCRFDMRALCLPGETGMDLIRREAGVHFPEYEERAKELNRLIDTGAWDEIKLVPAEPQTWEGNE